MSTEETDHKLQDLNAAHELRRKASQSELAPSEPAGPAKVVAAVPTGWAQPADGRCFTCDYFDHSKSHCQKHAGLTTPDSTCEDYNFALLNRQECAAAGLMAEPNK
jgi:hypothetical protein